MTVRSGLLVAALLLAGVVPARAAGPAPARKPPPAAAVAGRPGFHRATAAAADSAHHQPAAAVALPAHPSFSGRWKLAIEKSVFGKIPGGEPTARTDTIAHDGTRLRQTLFILRGAQRDTTIYDYATDGSPTVNKVDGRDIHTVANWVGPMLHLESTMKLLMFTMTNDEHWTLSADGRTLTNTRHVKYGFGEGDQTLVFERE